MNKDGRTPTEVRRVTQLVLAVIGGLALVSVLVLLTVIWLSNLMTGGAVFRRIDLQTPFGVISLGKKRPMIDTLTLPAYPKSTGGQHTLSVWFRGTPEGQEASGYLAVLRFPAQAPLMQVQQWYQEQLGSDFVRHQGWLVEAESRKEEWISQVLPGSDSGAVVFQHEEVGRDRAVILQPGDDNMRVTLYEYRKAEERRDDNQGGIFDQPDMPLVKMLGTTRRAPDCWYLLPHPLALVGMNQSNLLGWNLDHKSCEART